MSMSRRAVWSSSEPAPAGRPTAALDRVAVLRSDPELLTLADKWVVRAARGSDEAGAFDSEELGLNEARTGPVSELGARAAAAVSTVSSRELTAGSLHKADVDIAVLAADLAEPETAAMPFFSVER